MSAPVLTPQESRLAAFCRLFAVVYFAGALCFAIFPGLSYRIATLDGDVAGLGPEALFWNVLAVAMMTSVGTACLVTAARPRERRHAILPVAVAKLTSSVLAALYLAGGQGSRALAAVLATDLPLLALTLAIYRAAAPGVHSEPAREGRPAIGDPPKVQLKVSKS